MRMERSRKNVRFGIQYGYYLLRWKLDPGLFVANAILQILFFRSSPVQLEVVRGSTRVRGGEQLL